VSGEGGPGRKEYLAKYGADTRAHDSRGWMGSTLGCAELPQPQFDPFLAKEFR